MFKLFAEDEGPAKREGTEIQGQLGISQPENIPKREFTVSVGWESHVSH